MAKPKTTSGERSPEFRELESLTHRDRWNLDNCPELLHILTRAVDLPWLSERERLPPVASELSKALTSMLAELTQSGRRDVLQAGYKEADQDSHTIAAMGELLGLSNSDDFAARLDQLKLTKVFDTARTRKEHQDLKASRQLRAAFWLLDPLHNSESMGRLEKEKRYPYEDFLRVLSETLRKPEVVEGITVELETRLPREFIESLTPEPKLASVFQQPVVSGYIHRHQLEERFKAICDGGAKVIILHGLPGMGKTWLAEQLTWDYEADKPAPFIDASSKEDRKEPLSREDISDLACPDHAPPFLVIDNIDSANDLKELLPQYTKSVIVATSRRAADLPNTYADIHVDKMEKSECIEMAKSRLPDVNDDDADYLVSSFNGHPLVIDHICALFPNQPAPLRRLCDELKRDGTRLAGQARTEDRSILLAILRRAMRLVKQRDKNAFELVVIMSFIDHVVYKPLLLRYFERLFNFHARSSATIGFTMAIGLLAKFSLIQFDPTPKGFCIMHPFTQEVLRGEFDSRRYEVLTRIFIASNDLGEEIKAEGKVGGIFIFGKEGGMEGGYTWGSGDITLFIQNTKYNTEAISWMERNAEEFFDSAARGSRQASSVLRPLRIEQIDSGRNPH